MKIRNPKTLTPIPSPRGRGGNTFAKAGEGFEFILLVIYLSFVISHLSLPGYAVSPVVRIKDIAHVLEARENQLMGFGLVVGLNNTGDRSQTGFTQQALTNLLSRMGVVPEGVDFKARNVAAVMVTATLPPFVKSGQKIDVTVSSVGDATSLQGGTLLVTPLQGADEQVYAGAQGSVAVGLEPQSPLVPYVAQRQATTGRIPGGALVEKEVPVTLGDKNLLTIVLDNPDFTTASRVVAEILGAGIEARAKDAGTIVVPITEAMDLVNLVYRIENLTVRPDIVAKIVINERSGTIVIGENVRIAPVAVSYKGIDVTIGDLNLFSQTGADEASRYGAVRTLAKVERREGKFSAIPAGAALADLVRALNAIGASTQDMISILQAMKKAGAIKAELEVI